MQASANARAKAERNARKVAEQQAKEAKKQAAAAQAKADKLAREAEKKLAKAQTEKDRIQAERMRDQATAMSRYSQLATKAAEKSEKKTDPGEGLAIASAALEFAKQAMAPMSAIAAINAASTPEGKALAASVTDAVNRDDDFDPEEILRSFERGDPYAVDQAAMLDVEGPDHAHEVAGSCCASCSMGAESCGGSRDVPAALVNGEIAGSEDDDDAGDFLSYFLGGEAGTILAGPDVAPSRSESEDRPFFAPPSEHEPAHGDADVWGASEDLAALFGKRAAL